MELAGVCDPSADLSSISAPVFKDFDSMTASVEFDAAVVCVPTTAHFAVGSKLIGIGKHLLIEKPIASCVREATEMRDAAINAGVRLAVGHVERFNPAVQALRAALSGKRIFSIAITRVGPFPPRIADVGVLVDLSVHDIDLVRFISGREIVEKSILKSQKIHERYEDNAILSFKLEEEIVATVTTNWLTPFKKRKIEVATHEGYYEADLMRQELVEYSQYRLDNSFITRVCNVKRSEPLLEELIAFRDLVLSGDGRQLATADDGIRTLEILG
jgi:predicted dehydrogenase